MESLSKDFQEVLHKFDKFVKDEKTFENVDGVKYKKAGMVNAKRGIDNEYTFATICVLASGKHHIPVKREMEGDVASLRFLARTDSPFALRRTHQIPVYPASTKTATSHVPRLFIHPKFRNTDFVPNPPIPTMPKIPTNHEYQHELLPRAYCT
ncbi:hypothetical protein AgCh_019639 [Apium graveolens]